MVFALSGCACFVPRIASSMCTSGSFWVGDYSQQFTKRYDDPRWKVPECIVLWGNNPIISNSDGLYGHWAVSYTHLVSMLAMACSVKVTTTSNGALWPVTRAV